MSEKHLVLLSGGPDSVWPLKMLLTETQVEIVALHVTIFEETQRHVFESKACADVVTYCRRAFRDFRYEKASLTPTMTAHSYADLTVLASFVAMLCAGERGYGTVWIGAEINGGYGDRERAFREILAISMGIVTSTPPPQLSISSAHRTKRELRLALGDDLWALTWSCRYPQEHRACGKCSPCLNRREAED